MKMTQMVGLVALCVAWAGCGSDAEEVTGTYDGDTNTILMIGNYNGSSLERRTVPIVPQEGEDAIVIVGWNELCRAEAVVEGMDLEVSTSTCTFPFQGGTLRLTYEGEGDVSSSGKLSLDLRGSATYIDANGASAEGTFSFTFTGSR
jgi:hypothetical protein